IQSRGVQRKGAERSELVARGRRYPGRVRVRDPAPGGPAPHPQRPGHGRDRRAPR
ncbi:unnamed protein product, partial [Ectocarpus sp. 4 AP-2014]